MRFFVRLFLPFLEEIMISELQIGVITQTHGLHGEVKVFPTTDDARRFNKLKEVTLDDGKSRQTIEIDSVRFFKKYVILKFNGLDSIEVRPDTR